MKSFNLSEDGQLRGAALAILNSGVGLNRRSGAFLGQTVAEPLPLSPKQLDWFLKLAERASIEVEP